MQLEARPLQTAIYPPQPAGHATDWRPLARIGNLIEKIRNGLHPSPLFFSLSLRCDRQENNTTLLIILRSQCMASLSAPPVNESASGRTWSWLLGWAGAQHISVRRSQQPQHPPSPPATATAATLLLAAGPTHPIPARPSSERQRPLSHCGIYDIPIYQPPVFQHSNRSAPLVGLISAPSGSTIHAQHRSRRPQSSERAAMTQPTQSADRTSKPLPELPPRQSRDSPAAGQSDRVRKSGSLHRHCPSSPTLSTMLGAAPSTAVVSRQWSLRRPASVPLQSGNHDFSIFRRAPTDEQIPPQDGSAVGAEKEDLCPAEAELFPDGDDGFASTKDTQYVSGGDWDFDRVGRFPLRSAHGRQLTQRTGGGQHVLRRRYRLRSGP